MPSGSFTVHLHDGDGHHDTLERHLTGRDAAVHAAGQALAEDPEADHAAVVSQSPDEAVCHVVEVVER